MSKGLSALKYIRNNKRKVSVLVVSLTLCIAIIYSINFLLSVTMETMKYPLVKNPLKIQYIQLSAQTLKMDSDIVDKEKHREKYIEKNKEIAKLLEEDEHISFTCFSQVIYSSIRPPIGTTTFEIPTVNKEDIPILLKHFDAKLSEGKLPENEGELVIDSKLMKMNHYKLGGYFEEDNYGKIYKITGVLKSDTYFACGTPYSKNTNNLMITVLSDGTIKNMSEYLKKYDIDTKENYDKIIDYKVNSDFYQKDCVEIIDNTTRFIFPGIMIILFICLLVLYITYLRDRYSEWCLYCSIGYSRKAIYFMILRELGYVFILSALIGLVVTVIMISAMNMTIVSSIGARSRFIYPEIIAEIFGCIILFLGVLQIPVKHALGRVQTIDALEDDLY